MISKNKAYLFIHISVFLWGFTAILGRVIESTAYAIVFWRVLFTSISLFVILWVLKKLRWPNRKMLLIYMGIGVLVALHWITFYGAVKLANASVALVCFATTSFFTSLIEPVLVKSKFSYLDLGIGLIIIPSMIFIVNGLDASFQNGIIVGLISAILACTFSSLNKKYIDKEDPIVISFLEIGAGTLFLAVLFPVVFLIDAGVQFLPIASKDWYYLLLLALGCTTLPYILSMYALKKLSAFATNLVVNLEPVYGIILAYILLNENEQLNASFYIGSTLICLSVMFYPMLKSKFARYEST